MAGLSPTITSHPRKRRRDSGFPFRLTLPTVAPGQIPGALRFVSPALHIPPQKGERHRRNVSARKASKLSTVRKQVISKAQLPVRAHNHTRNEQHTASLDELAEPNYYNKSIQTSSTDDFASHHRERISKVWHGDLPRDPYTALRISAAALPPNSPQLADSVSSLYTTSFLLN